MDAMVSVILFLAAQTLGLIIWATRLGERVRVLEQFVEDEKRTIQHIDVDGTRALALIKERQDHVIHRLDRIETILDDIAKK